MIGLAIGLVIGTTWLVGLVEVTSAPRHAALLHLLHLARVRGRGEDTTGLQGESEEDEPQIRLFGFLPWRLGAGAGELEIAGDQLVDLISLT